jgi:signal transduction histidine kinase
MLVWAVVARAPWSRGSETSGGVWLLLVCAAIAGSIALVLRRIAVPVADLIAAANRIGRRDFRARVESSERGPRWVRDVSRAFNAMATELDAQDQARRHLMADIAHELRTPLTIVQGKLEGLIDGVYPRDDERLQGLLEDTRMLTRLVDDLRTLSTAESGALGLAKEPTDIVALVHDVVASLEPQARAAGVEMEVQAGAELDGQAMSMDPVRVREVLVNLLVNALHHTPANGRVTAVIKETAADVEFRVADTGPGIAPDELPRIFDRFHKGAGSRGSGLGLTIARSLIEAHGGTIRAESLPGAGTTIVFTLPR